LDEIYNSFPRRFRATQCDTICTEFIDLINDDLWLHQIDSLIKKSECIDADDFDFKEVLIKIIDNHDKIAHVYEKVETAITRFEAIRGDYTWLYDELNEILDKRRNWINVKLHFLEFQLFTQ